MGDENCYRTSSVAIITPPPTPGSVAIGSVAIIPPPVWKTNAEIASSVESSLAFRFGRRYMVEPPIPSFPISVPSRFFFFYFFFKYICGVPNNKDFGSDYHYPPGSVAIITAPVLCLLDMKGNYTLYQKMNLME